METLICRALVSQKSAPNKKLADIIARVETKYGVNSAELDDEWLGLVSAAGEQKHPHYMQEDEDE